MKHILTIVVITLLLTSCGGSRKTKVYEGMKIYKIVPSTHLYKKSVLYCKYFAGEFEAFERPFKFIDTCGKFSVGDIVYPKFIKHE